MTISTALRVAVHFSLLFGTQCLSTNVVFAQDISAEGARIEIRVLFRSDDTEIPVESRVSVKNSDIETETDREGVAILDLPKCDQSVRIVAHPFFDIFSDAEKPCDGSPLELLIAARYDSRTALLLLNKELAGAVAVAQLPAVEAQLKEIRDAYRGRELAAVAQLAADLSFALRQQSPSVAQSLSVISMDAGYRALGLDPTSPEEPLIAFDPSQQLYVMTPRGAQSYQVYADVVGLDNEQLWSESGLKALNALESDSTALETVRATIRNSVDN